MPWRFSCATSWLLPTTSHSVKRHRAYHRQHPAPGNRAKLVSFKLSGETSGISVASREALAPIRASAPPLVLPYFWAIWRADMPLA